MRLRIMSLGSLDAPENLVQSLRLLLTLPRQAIILGR